MGLSNLEIVGGRYAIYDEIASGGMASVYFGCLLGAASFSRTVAIKRLHAHLAREHEFVAMFLDEARVAARIHHPNVVSTLDVVATEEELFLVMEYVHGESLSRLLREMRSRCESLSGAIACAIVVGMLQGLHAAHEATDERGESLRIVHRDVSPHNLIVGGDGVARVVDFGVAKAAGRLQTTQAGQVKGKFGYMAPEQVLGEPITRAADVYSAGVVMWEVLTGMRLFASGNETQLLDHLLSAHVPAPSCLVAGVTPELDGIVLRALERDPARRFETARSMARAIEAVAPVASGLEVAEWVETLAGATLARRAVRLAEIEGGWATRSNTRDRQWLAGLSVDARPLKSSSAAPEGGDPARATRVDGRVRSSGPTPGLATVSAAASPDEVPNVRRSRSLRLQLATALAAALLVGSLLTHTARVHARLHQWLFGSTAEARPSAPAMRDGAGAHGLLAASFATQESSPPSPGNAPAVSSPSRTEPPTIPIDALPRAPRTGKGATHPEPDQATTVATIPIEALPSVVGAPGHPEFSATRAAKRAR